MGTLTAGQPRLPEYCEHKLPTSCRLTSISCCCACADERPHAAEYRTYIDGVGFVPRGTRWQRYCWFCKEFWQNRVNASGLRPQQTRVPQAPDQKDFLDRWYEFWQGYRVIGVDDDGQERRQAVVGEDLKDVSPGCLPRTLEELRAGRERSEADSQLQPPQIERIESAEGQSLDATLDQLLMDASLEEAARGQPQPQSISEPAAELDSRAIPPADPPISDTAPAQAVVPATSLGRDHQARRIFALRRELHRMRSGVERVITGLRDLGMEVPDHSETTSRLSRLSEGLNRFSVAETPAGEADGVIASTNASVAAAAAANPSRQDRSLASMYARVNEAREQLDHARRSRDHAANVLELADRELRAKQERLQQLQREQRTIENYMHVFGTRQEFLAAGEEYESPIGGMFTRAWERFRVAEEVRRETRTLRQVLNDEEAAGGETAQRLLELENRERDVWGVPRTIGGQTSTLHRHGNAEQTESSGDTDQLTSSEATLDEYYRTLRWQNWTQQPAALAIARANDRRDEASRVQASSDGAGTVPSTASNRPGGAHGSLSRLYSSIPNQIPAEDWRDDALVILGLLVQDRSDNLRSYAGPRWTSDEAARLLSKVTNDSLDPSEREGIEQDLMENEDVVFMTSVPQRRIARAQRRILGIDFLPMRPDSSDDDGNGTDRNTFWNIELMAQAFMAAASVRREVELGAPERLQMLYRLQAGERCAEDRVRLRALLDNEAAMTRAREMVREIYTGENSESRRQRNAFDHERQAAARTGNHSRDELDANRRATSRLALAAGRFAMQSGPQSLLERIGGSQLADAQVHSETSRREHVRLPFSDGRGGYVRVRRSRWVNAYTSDSASSTSDDQEEQPAGLDAKDSGRPDPKTDDDMMVKMDCKICYTQTAEIACLPCGHLVMCQWCSEQHSPVMQHDRTRPRHPAACPVCRKGISKKVKVYRA